MTQSGFQIQITFELPANLGIQKSTAPVSGPVALSQGKAPALTTEPQPGGTVQLNSQVSGSVAGVLVNAGKEAGQETGVVTSGQIGLAVSSPPAQFLTLLDSDVVGTARLLSPGEAGSGASQLVGLGAGTSSSTASGHPGAAIRSRSLSTTYFSADILKDGNPDALPRPSSADLLASALPFDRASFIRVIDQFFQQFDDVNTGELAQRGPARIVVYALAISSTFAALDMVRRRWRRTGVNTEVRVRDSLSVTEQMGFPELPGRWSSRLS